MKDADIKTFAGWLTERGAHVAPPTNPYEILRVNTCFGVLVAYRGKKGETWDEKLLELYSAMQAGKQIPLCPDLKGRVQLRHTIKAIAERDGWECWFSGEKFTGLDDERISVEHLCPRSHGGPNHLSNLVIATKEWNQRAGNRSIAEKVRMREEARRQ